MDIIKKWKNLNGIFKNDYPSKSYKPELELPESFWNEISKETGVTQDMFIHTVFKVLELLKKEMKETDVESVRLVVKNVLFFFLKKPSQEESGVLGLKCSDTLLSFLKDEKSAAEVLLFDRVEHSKENGYDINAIRDFEKL